jgi:nucleotide-binding universal stress UspA family protein
VVKRVLYASDFTSGSQHALPYALALTRDYDADLTLLHVLENADQMAMYYREASMDDSLKELEALVPADVQLPHPPEFVVRAGQAAERIVDLAVDADASVIVIGVRAHGSAKLRAHLPWATAHQVVCHAPCPVLTVRGPAQ